MPSGIPHGDVALPLATILAAVIVHGLGKEEVVTATKTANERFSRGFEFSIMMLMGNLGTT